MRSKSLIIPGYIVGLGSLFIITYRTFLAFISNSKSITVNINRYGEQYLDLYFLIIIWIISLIGLIILLRHIKDEKNENNIQKSTYSEKDDKSDILFKINNFSNFVDEKIKFHFDDNIDVFKDINTRMNLSDDGKKLQFTYDSENISDNN